MNTLTQDPLNIASSDCQFTQGQRSLRALPAAKYTPSLYHGSFPDVEVHLYIEIFWLLLNSLLCYFVFIIESSRVKD